MAFNFSQNETVASIEEVPTELRPYYQEGDAGTFSLREDHKSAAAAWDGMAKANATIRQQNKDLSKGKIDLSPLSDFGSTPQEIRDAIDGRIEEMSQAIDAKKDAVNPDKLRKQLMEGFSEKEKQWEVRNGALQNQLYTTLVRDEAHKAIAEHKGNAHLLMSHVTDTVRTVEENGQLVARVFDSEGDVRLGNMGQAMTVSERVAELKRDDRYKVLFQADVKPGSNPPTNRLPGGVPGEAVAKTAAQKIQAGINKQLGR